MLGKVKAQFTNIQPSAEGMYITFRILPESYFLARQMANDCRLKAREGKDNLTLTVDIARNKRSLDQNAFLWALMEEIAVIIRSSRDEVYLQMLERYGVSVYLGAPPDEAEGMKKYFRLVVERGEIDLNGKPGIRLQCFPGSSKYNTAEMSRLIDGVISEARELGIDIDGVMAGVAI